MPITNPLTIVSNSIYECVFTCTDVGAECNDIRTPNTHQQAMLTPQREEWRNAEEQEIQSMMNNKVFKPTKLPMDRKAIRVRWIYRVKYDKKGVIKQYKARIVALGYQQIYGVDYSETYSQVARLTSLRILMAISSYFNLLVHQMDVDTAFLNAELKEEIYITPPEGINIPDGCDCLKLKKALYGLKQSPREWYDNLSYFLISIGFVKLHADNCMYIKHKDDNMCIVLIYVDDIAIAGSSIHVIDRIKNEFKNRYKMKDLGDIDHILGCAVDRNNLGEYTINQKQYTKDVISKYFPDNLTPINNPTDVNVILSTSMNAMSENDIDYMKDLPYREAIGSLLWLSMGTRPDITYAVSQVAKYNSEPGPLHWKAVKRIFQYLQNTIYYGIKFKRTSCSADITKTFSIDVPIGYVDADHARDTDSRRSVTGYIFFLADGPVSWSSKQQSSVALSSMEAEYMAASAACQEAVWLDRVLKELGNTNVDVIVLFEDNKSCIQFTKNNNVHKRSKHIDQRYHYIRELVADSKVKLEYIPTDMNIADLFTKPISSERFMNLRDKFMVELI